MRTLLFPLHSNYAEQNGSHAELYYRGMLENMYEEKYPMRLKENYCKERGNYFASLLRPL